jgi:hypothetical protein
MVYVNVKHAEYIRLHNTHSHNMQYPLLYFAAMYELMRHIVTINVYRLLCSHFIQLLKTSATVIGIVC